MRILATLFIALAASWLFLQTTPPLWEGCGFSRAACAEESWKDEFDQVCSKTQDAMTFTTAELRSLLDRCDALKPVIESLDESHRKVPLKRLQMCRELYLFVLEEKEKK